VGRKNASFGKLILIISFLFIIFKGKAQEPLLEKNTDENIRTILLYHVLENEPFENKYRNSPIVNLNVRQALVFEFDDLSASYRQFRAKIIHTDENWIPSKLRELQYLKDFNEYFINDFKVSQGPKVNYYHYFFQVPKPKISGNYILKIYEGYDESKIIIQRKFTVLEPKIGVQCSVTNPQSNINWKTQQQLNIDLLFGNYFINFPQKELIVKVVQNQNRYTERKLSNENLVKIGPNKFAFKNFQDSLLFNGGNEYRYIDFSDAYRHGQNVENIKISEPNQVYSTLQKSRGKFNYVQSYDSDGNYVINTPERLNPDLTADYFNVHFVSENKSQNAPKIIGKFTNYEPVEMELNPNLGNFESSFLLKQGVYDYLIDAGENFEGNFSDTNNTYEIFVYQKTPAKAYIELIGYTKIQMGR
jgi:Domain of unknown function (DUF5103)